MKTAYPTDAGAKLDGAIELATHGGKKPLKPIMEPKLEPARAEDYAECMSVGFKAPTPDQLDGTKEVNGKLKKKCYYRCPECNTTGKHRILKRDTVNCHSCKCEIKVQPATNHDGPDRYGNWFVAGDFKPTKKVVILR